jgi:hypothetical protein
MMAMPVEGITGSGGVGHNAPEGYNRRLSEGHGPQ